MLHQFLSNARSNESHIAVLQESSFDGYTHAVEKVIAMGFRNNLDSVTRTPCHQFAQRGLALGMQMCLRVLQ